MSLINIPDQQQDHSSRLKVLQPAGILLAGLSLAVIIAYLLATGKIMFAGVLIAAPIVVLVVHRYPFASILVWLLLSPFLNFTNTASERMVYWTIHRALPPGTLVVIIVASILGINKRRLPKLGYAEWFMLGYVVVSILSIYVLSPTPQATFYRFYDRVLIPMLLYLIVRLSSPDQKDIQRLLPVIFFIAVSQSIFGLLSWAAPGMLPRDWLGAAGQRTTGSLVNTTVYTATLIFSGLILLYSALNQRSWGIRNILLTTFALTLMLVFLSFSRASWLGGIVVLVGVAILYPRFATIMATAIVIVTLLFGAVLLTRFSWVVEQANQRLYSEEAANSAFSRLPVFYAALRMIAEKPLFGWGYGDFDLYDRQFYVQDENFVGDNKDHASHNFFLTLTAEQGLVGFLLFAGPLFYWLGQTIRKGRQTSPEGSISMNLPILLWLFILNMIIQINFSNLRVVFGWGIWWIALGLIASMVYPALTREKAL